MNNFLTHRESFIENGNKGAKIKINKPLFDNIQKKILVVDDEPFNILGMQQILNMIGPKNISKSVDTAHNGMEALNAVKTAHYNKEDQYCYGLIFIDLSMPVMNGYEATDKIRQFIKRKNLP